MIELLGVGLQDTPNAWRLRKACGRFPRGALSAVVTVSPADAAGLVDVLVGRRIPDDTPPQAPHGPSPVAELECVLHGEPV